MYSVVGWFQGLVVCWLVSGLVCLFVRAFLARWLVRVVCLAVWLF